MIGERIRTQVLLYFARAALAVLRPAAAFALLGSSFAQAALEPGEPGTSPGPWLLVDHAEGAEGCPTARALLQQIEPLLDAKQPLIGIEVSFAKRGETFSAEIRRTGQDGVRKLTDTHYDCGPLAGAVATAVALLVDADAPPPLPPPPSLEAQAIEPPPVPAPPRPIDAFLGMRASFGPVFALVEGSQPAAALGLFGARGRLSAQVDGWGALRGSVDLEPGSLRYALTGAALRGCVRVLGGVTLHAALCTGFFGANLRVTARGFDSNEESHTPWLAVPVGIQMGARLSSERGWAPGVRVGLTALVPLRRQTFRIDGLTAEMTTPRAGIWLWGAVDLSYGWGERPSRSSQE